MFLGRKNQYCENEYTTQSNLEIQCNPYQAINGNFHRTRTNIRSSNPSPGHISEEKHGPKKYMHPNVYNNQDIEAT